MKIQNLVTESEISKSFDAFLELRPHLTDARSFVTKVLNQRKEGYNLVAITYNDEVVSCVGFRIMRTLAHGKILYIDDLMTKEKWRGKGYGKALMNHVNKIAQNEECEQIHLDSGYKRHAAHKVYLKYGFEFTAHHLSMKIN